MSWFTHFVKWGFYKAIGEGKLSIFSPEEMKKLSEEYKISIDLPKEFKGDLLEGYKKPDFSEVGRLNAELANLPEFQAIGLDSKKFDTAKQNYSESITTFNKLVDQVGPTYNAQDLITSFIELNEQARKELENQHTLENTEVKNLFQSPGFKQLENHEDLQKNIQSQLDNKQKEELAAFDEKATAQKNQLHNAAAQEYKQLWLAIMHKHYPEKIQDEIARIVAAREDEENSKLTASEKGLIVSVGVNHEGITLKDVDIKTLNLIALSGREIKQEADGTYKIKFGARVSQPLFYLDPRFTVEADIRSVVEAVKAGGHDAITLNVDFSDPELAKKRGKQAVEAAMEAGFALEKITVNVNGKKTQASELLLPAELKRAELKSAHNTAELKKILTEATPKGTELVKSKLKFLVEAGKEVEEGPRVIPPAV